MASTTYQDKLGSPSIHLAGLQIWIHHRQFPGADDYWNGNWVHVTAHCGAKGADVWVSGAIIHLPEIAQWADAAEVLHQSLVGEANLECMEPELSVSLTGNERGGLEMRVELTPDILNQSHAFTFELDQSYLPTLIRECRKVLADFPPREAS